LRFQFQSPTLPAAARALRREVRAFLDEERTAGRLEARANSWLVYDAGFTLRCAQHGYIGMTFPGEYGGHGRSALERYVVCEELLAAGAPLGMHWIADRQSGPQILRHGSEAARRRIIPEIVAGRCCIGIGMSEPNAGSDLAAVRTRGMKAEGGWRITPSSSLPCAAPRPPARTGTRASRNSSSTWPRPACAPTRSPT
jgi:alkylation response protein AidB-like acyl-CoA dehydrogenase